MKFIKIIWIWK